MDLEKIRTHWLLLYFTQKNKHPLVPILTFVFGGGLGMLISPVIGAFCFALSLYLALVIYLPWKIILWEDVRDYHRYYISAIIILAIAYSQWGGLVDFLDHDNPYKKPLQTGTASVEIIIDSNTTNSSDCYAGDCASILLSGDGPKVFFVMTSQNSIYERSNKKNEATCWATAFNLPAVNDSVGKPISRLSEAKFAQVFFKELGNQTIKRGSLIFIFNSSVRVEIPIQPQTINDFTGVYIPDIGKYFEKGN
jgi:hypothetical protein